jgi:hypothetical protein
MAVTFDPVCYKDSAGAQRGGRGHRLACLGPDAGGLARRGDDADSKRSIISGL